MMIEKFLEYLKYERNRSELTMQSYGEDLRTFEKYFKSVDEQLDWTNVDTDVVRDWMETMMDSGNSAATVARRLSALRSFYKFAMAHKLADANPVYGVKSPKRKRRLPVFIKESEMDMLIDNVDWDDSIKDVRMRTIIILFYSTGIRLSELTNLDDKDISFVNNEIKVTGKRDKQRIIPFGDELRNVLQYYIAKRDKLIVRQTDALIVTDKGVRMSADQVRYIVKKTLSLVSTQKKRSPHVLRHTFATAMLNNEAGLLSIQKLLGHESVQTTEIYTHTTFEQLKRVYNQAHPRA
jgi:integrase/recombinase XerC